MSLPNRLAREEMARRKAEERAKREEEAQRQAEERRRREEEERKTEEEERLRRDREEADRLQKQVSAQVGQRGGQSKVTQRSRRGHGHPLTLVRVCFRERRKSPGRGRRPSG